MNIFLPGAAERSLFSLAEIWKVNYPQKKIFCHSEVGVGGVFNSKTTRTDEEEAFLGTFATSHFFLNSG